MLFITLPVDGTNDKKSVDVNSDAKKDEAKKDEAKKDEAKKDEAKKEGSKAVTLESSMKTCQREWYDLKIRNDCSLRKSGRVKKFPNHFVIFLGPYHETGVRKNFLSSVV